MNEPHAATGPDVGAGWYHITIRGRLDQRWSAWFDAATLAHGPDGTTVLRAHVNDQAALHAVIHKVGGLGLQLVSVARDGAAPDPIVRTHRLDVRPFTAADVETLSAYRADPDVARYQSWSDFTVEQGAALVKRMQQLQFATPGSWYQLALEDRMLGILVGDLACKVNEREPREMEVGFTIAPAHQGRGYATEALHALLDLAFTTMSLHRVVALTDARNSAAAALLTKVGMRQEGHFHDNVFFKGEWGSELLFARLAREHVPSRSSTNPTGRNTDDHR